MTVLIVTEVFKPLYRVLKKRRKSRFDAPFDLVHFHLLKDLLVPLKLAFFVTKIGLKISGRVSF